MSYEAIITPIVNIRPHSNADKLMLGTAAGHQVIISKDITEGTRGIFFPSDGQLSLDMCKENNLHRHVELNADPKANGGFFDDNRRVRAQKFRGEISEGFWVELKILDWTGADTSLLKDGELISELNGKAICNKYYTPATQRAMNSGGKNSKKGFKPNSFPHFKEHFHTQKLRMMINFIPVGAILSITEKCHGTSARTGHLVQKKQLNWLQKAWNKTIGHCGWVFTDEEHRYVSGTRRVVLDPKKIEDTGFYSGDKFRSVIHNKIKSAGLIIGETIYYEIVGYTENGGLIMGSHGLEDKDLKKKYGNCMAYTYGCVPNESKILVYRITHTSPDDYVTELPWTQMIQRCKTLRLETVPQLMTPFIYDGDQQKLLAMCESLSQGSSTLDIGHIREGVVVRVEAPGIDTHYKIRLWPRFWDKNFLDFLKEGGTICYKSYWFCELEGIAKNSDEYVDPEEIS